MNTKINQLIAQKRKKKKRFADKNERAYICICVRIKNGIRKRKAKKQKIN